FMRSPPANKPSDTLIPKVEVYSVQPYQGNLDLVVSGTVVPFKEIKVAAEVGGRITEKMPACDAGTYVQKGTPLIVIDRESYELEVKTLEAEVAQSKNLIIETEKELLGIAERIAIAEQELVLLQNEFERNERLKNVVSSTELDQSKRGMLTAQSQLSSWQNNKLTAEARLERVKSALVLSERKLERSTLNLAKTNIVAPEDGVVVKDNVEKGDFVSAGTILLTFEATENAEIISNLTMTDLNWIKQNVAATPGNVIEEDLRRIAYELPKMNVKIFDPREPEIQWIGTLERFDGIGLDKMTKTIPVRIVVAKPVVGAERGSRTLVRGMFVKCRIEVPPDARADSASHLIFPAKAIRSGSFVWSVTNNRLRQHRVKIVNNTTAVDPKYGNEEQQLAIVRQEEGGLQPGDNVVISPIGQPSDGTEVMVIGDEKSETPATTSDPSSEPPKAAD
ncbi:MAG: HlyD family efflux transporter periplasmic adaptor subunit, partial [Pirellulaceae bacterium]